MKKFVSNISLVVVLLFIFTMMFSGVSSNVEAADNKVKVLIQFAEQPGESEKALIRAFGGEIEHVFTIVPGMSAEIPESAIFGLSKNPHILSIEPNLEVHAIGEFDSEYANTWGVDRIGADDVVYSGNTGAGVKVAVLDSGINYNHPDLSANYAGGYDFVNGDSNPMDDNGHGTHVAGTIAAVANGAGVIGVAPDVEIYALKVLGSDGSGNFGYVIAALQWCVDNGIKVTNASLGSSGDPGSLVEDAYIAADAAGIINISSAGNEGKRNGRGDNVGYPAAYPSVVAVAATDINDNRASFSSTGPDVEIAAPGVDILSTYQDGYAYGDGTSMASPHVAGVAALMIKAGYTTPDSIRAAMQATAIDLGAPGHDTWYGYGLIDAFAAVGGTPPANQAPVVMITSPADGSSFAEGTEITFTGTAGDDNDGDLSGSISWSADGIPLGTGASVTAILDVGTHTITAEATDSESLTGSDSITVTIETTTVNEIPTVNITSPADGNTYEDGTVITFTGTANDTEDGDLSSSISWTSSIDLNIGSGASFSTVLSAGTHTITATATDSEGAAASDSITVTVNEPPGTEDEMYISSIVFETSGGRYKNAHLEIFVGLEDEAAIPVTGAVVTIALYHDESLYSTSTATTDGTGIAPFKFPGIPYGDYYIEVVSASASGFNLVGGTPDNSFTK